MNRRKLLGLLAGVPFLGALIRPSDGGVLNPAPVVEWDWIYAEAGEIVTCENQHPICTIAETVVYGQMQDTERHFTQWRQQKPKLGTLPIPICAQCGAAFTTGSQFHFADGWRTRASGYGLTKTATDMKIPLPKKRVPPPKGGAIKPPKAIPGVTT